MSWRTVENFFYQYIKIYVKAYGNMIEITGCLLDFTYFKENYKLISINLSK